MTFGAAIADVPVSTEEENVVTLFLEFTLIVSSSP
jgi:hypothetical protein